MQIMLGSTSEWSVATLLATKSLAVNHGSSTQRLLLCADPESVVLEVEAGHGGLCWTEDRIFL